MNKNTLIFILLTLLLVVLALFSLSWGRFAVPIDNVVQSLMGNNTSDVQNNIIFNLRLPRILAAILVGAALAVAGATFQGIFRNPLVSPDLQGLAFMGGLIAVLMTMSLPKLVRRDSTIILVLSGIIISGFMMACLGLIKYLADPETQLADIVYWQMGSLTKVDYKNLSLLSPIILFTTGGLLMMRWRINVLSLGDREAKLIGANIRLERSVMVIFSTLLTASAVCLSGTIGWIGLIIPHLARMFIGDNNLRALPLSALIGVIFLLVIDTLARNLYTQEIPLGILTGFIGAPFFAWVLVKQKVAE